MLIVMNRKMRRWVVVWGMVLLAVELARDGL